MSALSTSSLAARLLLQKNYNSNLYSSMSLAIRMYSHCISKQLGTYASQDANIAGLLQPLLYLAAQEENAKRSEATDTEIAIKAVVFPVCFAATNFSKNNDNDSEAIKLLKSLFVIEKNVFELQSQALEQPAAQEIVSIISIEGMQIGTKARAVELNKTIDLIQNNTFWTRDGVWQCLNCGYEIKAPAAWDECPCCMSTKEHTTFIA